MTDIDAPEPRQGFADRLSHWLGWTDAISLADALDGGAMAPPARPSAASRPAASAAERECTRVRAALTKTLADHAAAARAGDTATDFPAFHRRYLAKQQAMELAVAPLRARMRAALAARSPALARLAAVDAVMEKMLGPRERSLLHSVPALLEKHFERLRQAEPDARADGWLAVFGNDMQAVLRAELEIRMQPVEGLLDALRIS
ncbi:MAG TPA: DUF3348 family protein [Burkholderiaceae bacterium]